MIESALPLRRGAVVRVDLDPVIGAEQGKVRPAVVVSNDHANAAAEARGRGVLTVVPLTSNVSRVLSFQVVVPRDESGMPFDSKAQAEQVRSLDVSRIIDVARILPAERMAALDAALALHLAL